MQNRYGNQNWMIKEVMDKVSAGIIYATIISFIITLLPIGLQLIFALIALVVEIIAIIGYFFAKKESTIEKLYYTFVISSAVLLGFTFTLVLYGDSQGMFVIASAFGITTLIVAYIYRKVNIERPDVMKHANKLFAFGIAFILLSIGMIFIGYGTIGNFIVSLLGAILFSFYLWFDLGRLMRGQFTSPARMAWNIYWDILLIFKYILRMISMLSRNR